MFPTKMDFNAELSKSISENIHNRYTDNFQESRFGKEKLKTRMVKILVKVVCDIGLIGLIKARKRKLISGFNYLYYRLNDDYSRNLLIKVLTYRLLGYHKVKLPMNNGNYFNKIEEIENSIINKSDFILTNFKGWKLHLHDIHKYGFPCQMYYTSSGIFHSFVHPEYKYKGQNSMVERGNVVIDAGACWGDTALYFAELVGNKGKVYSFEFLPDNLEILYKNLGLNKGYIDRVKIIEKPIWSTSNVNIYCDKMGPGNKVILEKNNETRAYKTISLDDFVFSNKLEKVDFIKMDIEGAELEALKGTEKVLKKYKPKLAICVYHKIEDCQEVPEYIESLNLDYKFYFDHYSIHGEESVLFARVEYG